MTPDEQVINLIETLRTILKQIESFKRNETIDFDCIKDLKEELREKEAQIAKIKECVDEQAEDEYRRHVQKMSCLPTLDGMEGVCCVS